MNNMLNQSTSTKSSELRSDHENTGTDNDFNSYKMPFIEFSACERPVGWGDRVAFIVWLACLLGSISFTLAYYIVIHVSK